MTFFYCTVEHELSFMKQTFISSERKKGLRRSMIVALAITLTLHLSAAFVCARQTNKKKVRALPSTLLITAVDKNGAIIGRGCGFFADKDGSVLTASRIVKDAQAVFLTTPDGKTRETQGIIAEDKELVLLKAWQNRKAPPLRFAAASKALLGSTVIACGRQDTGGVIELNCTVTGYQKISDGDMFQIEPPLSPDLNGCPVINERGEVVGAAVTLLFQKQQVSFVTPCEQLLQQRFQQPRPQTPPQPQPLSPGGAGFFDSGDYAQALALFQQAAQHKPASADDYFKMGYCLGELNRHAEALQAYRAALQLDSSLGKAWNNLGLSFAATGKLNDAVIAYQKALAVNRQDYEAYNNLGNAYIQLGMDSEARNALLEAVKTKPDSAEAHNNLGIAYLKLGDKGAALGQYTVLKRLDEIKAEKLFMAMYPAEP